MRFRALKVALAAVIVILACGPGGDPGSAQDAPRAGRGKPNILVIMTDDVGIWNISTCAWRIPICV